MADHAADPDAPERPRFPYAVAGLFLGCIACAAWLWMRYSYAWPATPSEIANGWQGRSDRLYVALTGDDAFVEREVTGFERLTFRAHGDRVPRWFWDEVRRERGVTILELLDASAGARILLPGKAERHTWEHDETVVYRGRLLSDGIGFESQPIVHASASRFAPESVAGLVVAAMGAFVFSLYFKKWLAGRRTALAAEGQSTP